MRPSSTEKAQQIYAYVSRWLWAGVLAWIWIPNFLAIYWQESLHTFPLTWIVFSLGALWCFIQLKGQNWVRLLVALTPFFFWRNLPLPQASVDDWLWLPKLLGTVLALGAHVFCLSQVFRVYPGWNWKKFVVSLAANGSIYFWIFFSSDFMSLHNYKLFFLLAVTCTVGSALFSYWHEEHVLAFVSVQQPRFVRVKQRIPIAIQKTLIWSVSLLILISAFLLISQLIGYEFDVSTKLFSDLLLRQLVANFIINYSVLVYQTIVTEKVDFLRLLQHLYPNPHSNESRVQFYIETLQPPENQLDQTAVHLWNSFTTLTLFDTDATREFFSSFEVWTQISAPLMKTIQNLTWKINQYLNENQKPKSPNKVTVWKKSTKEEILWKDTQVACWAIQSLARIVVVSKTEDRNGILQLHNQLAVVLDVFTDLWKALQNFFQFANSEPNNFRKPHIIREELSMAIYSIRNAFNTSLGMYQFQNAEILQQFADYQI